MKISLQLSRNDLVDLKELLYTCYDYEIPLFDKELVEKILKQLEEIEF